MNHLEKAIEEIEEAIKDLNNVAKHGEDAIMRDGIVDELEHIRDRLYLIQYCWT